MLEIVRNNYVVIQFSINFRKAFLPKYLVFYWLSLNNIKSVLILDPVKQKI